MRPASTWRNSTWAIAVYLALSHCNHYTIRFRSDQQCLANRNSGCIVCVGHANPRRFSRGIAELRKFLHDRYLPIDYHHSYLWVGLYRLRSGNHLEGPGTITKGPTRREKQVLPKPNCWIRVHLRILAVAWLCKHEVDVRGFEKMVLCSLYY